MTPGDALDVTVADICTIGYTKRIRQVRAVVKRKVYAEYAREPQEGVCCEVDHLIPLELGGSNRATNLWPEPYDIEWKHVRIAVGVQAPCNVFHHVQRSRRR